MLTKTYCNTVSLRLSERDLPALPQEAMDATLRSDKALPLLDAAADKFAEVTISGAAPSA